MVRDCEKIFPLESNAFTTTLCDPVVTLNVVST